MKKEEVDIHTWLLLMSLLQNVSVGNTDTWIMWKAWRVFYFLHIVAKALSKMHDGNMDFSFYYSQIQYTTLASSVMLGGLAKPFHILPWVFLGCIFAIGGASIFNQPSAVP